MSDAELSPSVATLLLLVPPLPVAALALLLLESLRLRYPVVWDGLRSVGLKRFDAGCEKTDAGVREPEILDCSIMTGDGMLARGARAVDSLLPDICSGGDLEIQRSPK